MNSVEAPTLSSGAAPFRLRGQSVRTPRRRGRAAPRPVRAALASVRRMAGRKRAEFERDVTLRRPPPAQLAGRGDEPAPEPAGLAELVSGREQAGLLEHDAAAVLGSSPRVERDLKVFVGEFHRFSASSSVRSLVVAGRTATKETRPSRALSGEVPPAPSRRGPKLGPLG